MSKPDHGAPRGEDHPLARLTNAEVEQLRAMYRQPDVHGIPIGQKRLAKIFEVSRRSVRDILTGRRR